MQCSQCQQDNPPQARFCLACGVRLTLSCRACGTELPAGARFCLACGQPVSAPDTVQPRPTAPVAYTPKHLAEKILTSRGALEGERKQVTVLFCDLANSTALAERLGPEAMHTLLNRFFELALAEVHRYEGTINQFLGDGFMALFGAPLAHEDHARRAVLAALGVQQRLRQEGVEAEPLTAGTEYAPTQQLSMRMGLNTGPVVVGSIGDNLRMDYTAVGDTTNLAARLHLCGWLDKARDLALQGLEMTRDLKYWHGIGWAQRALGRIAQASGSLTEAESHLREALQTFVSIQARFEVGRTHLDLAVLAHAAGDQEATTTHLKEAHGLFSALQVPKYVARAEQRAREFGVSLPPISVPLQTTLPEK